VQSAAIDDGDGDGADRCAASYVLPLIHTSSLYIVDEAKEYVHSAVAKVKRLASSSSWRPVGSSRRSRRKKIDRRPPLLGAVASMHR
jgi:hypothetical protein